MSLPSPGIPLLIALGGLAALAGASIGLPPLRERGCRRGMTVLSLSGMPMLVIPALLVIASSAARAGVLTEERTRVGLWARHGLAAVGLPQQQQRQRGTDSRTAPASCPYRFGSDMPTATFCAYQGVALGSSGEVCATGVVVIWSGWSVEGASGASRDVYLGFIADSGLVLQATASPRQGNRADIVAYTTGSVGTPRRKALPRPMAGEVTLRTVWYGSRRTADVLSMELRYPPGEAAACAFVSYSGTFVGLIRPPQ